MEYINEFHKQWIERYKREQIEELISFANTDDLWIDFT